MSECSKVFVVEGKASRQIDALPEDVNARRRARLA